ncbi:FAD-dependent oxidoreductase, partial [Candidatus Sumerlaeota bacterium]|nr:FAD-dependent oxidoreductase [Candidatus Sumerlaeota bacterium]
MAQPFRVVVIGGVAAGPKIAAKVARLRPDAEVTLIEKGERLSYAGCGLAYYIADMVREQQSLMTTPAGVVRDVAFFQNVKNVKVLSRTEALEIDRGAKRVLVKSSTDGSQRWIEYDKLALATGARPVVPPIPGVGLANVFTLKTIEEADRIKEFIAANPHCKMVIVGGGLIGVEMAEALVGRKLEVTLVEMLPHILAPLDTEMALLVEKHMRANEVELLTNTWVEAFDGADQVEYVVTSQERIATDAVVLAVGVRPQIELAKAAGIEIGSTGAIRVDEHMRTSDPDIYAAGDCVETINLVSGRPVYAPLGSTANKQGRVAAIAICGGDERFPGVLCSAIVKVFDFNAGWTGLSESAARELGYEVAAGLVPAPDRSDYYPGKRMVMLKLIAEGATGRLLGAQAIGPGETAKRLDVAVTAISAGMTADQVSKLDLCYAPPYSAAMDSIITAANVIRNKIAGQMNGVSSIELGRRLDRGEDIVVLDVRSPAEYESGHLEGAINIPLGALRKRCGELPRDRKIVAY